MRLFSLILRLSPIPSSCSDEHCEFSCLAFMQSFHSQLSLLACIALSMYAVCLCCFLCRMCYICNRISSILHTSSGTIQGHSRGISPYSLLRVVGSVVLGQNFYKQRPIFIIWMLSRSLRRACCIAIVVLLSKCGSFRKHIPHFDLC